MRRGHCLALGVSLALTLQGCGANGGGAAERDATTTSTTAPATSTTTADATCGTGQCSWAAGECCCLYCDGGVHATGGIQLACLAAGGCAARGGQCKPNTTSPYIRPGVSELVSMSSVREDANDTVQQAHLIGGWPDEVTIVFVTSGNEPSVVYLREPLSKASWSVSGQSSTYNVMLYPMGRDFVPSHGITPGGSMTYCDPGNYSKSECFYTSPVIHTVRIEGLKPKTTYYYKPGSSQRWRSFSTTPAIGEPISFGLVADLGQTRDSLSTMGHLNQSLAAGHFDAILFPGDLTYSDGYAPAWDTWGRLSEFLLERVPTAFVPGNHEVASGMENFANFAPRYAWPAAKVRNPGESPMWFSFEAGLVHVVGLCSYCDVSEGSLQRAFLEADLARTDRGRTPWVIVMMHVPFYSSNAHHSSSESDAMKASMEELMYKHKVDLIISGHVHAYERTAPVFKYQEVCDAPMQVVVGDGGNHEGPACPWNLTAPSWSLHREFSFGYSRLRIVNSTHAHFEWHRNQDGDDIAADDGWLQTSASRCQRADGAELVI